MKKGCISLLSLVTGGVLLAACGFSSAAPSPTSTLTFEVTSTPTGEPVDAPTFDANLVDQGRALYHFCTTCHGRTGRGIDEARLGFPETHRKCERCHRSGNRPTSMDPANIFSIGQPPPLRDLATSDRFASPQSLYQFIRSTMPRYYPGMLSDEEYWALTAFLWEGLPLDDHTLP